MTFWDAFQYHPFRFDSFESGARVLDVGFGEGQQLRALREAGCVASGVEYNASLVEDAAREGFEVRQGVAEHLPFADNSFDGLVCKVVIPYTDEARAIEEWSRVLRDGGRALVSYHGAGYYLRYVVEGDDWKARVYGARSLINTWWYALTSSRLPGFFGDTLYQSEARLRKHYLAASLTVRKTHQGKRYWGKPVFILHELSRSSRGATSRLSSTV